MVRMRLILILATAALLANVAHARSPSDAQPDPSANFVPGRVLVKWRSTAAARLHQSNVVFKRQLAPDRALLETTPTPQATRALLESLRANPDVAWAEPDYIRQRYGAVATTPSDPLFSKQWALPMIQAPAGVGRRLRGSATVTVAVIDTGYVAHPEIADRVVAGYDFISDPANSGDGDGRDADPTDTGDASDQSSALHGTHVAGHHRRQRRTTPSASPGSTGTASWSSSARSASTTAPASTAISPTPSAGLPACTSTARPTTRTPPTSST